jgi:hypothetical protein
MPVLPVDAAVRAAKSAGGSFLPLDSARRRIPAQAFGLKKNRGATGPVSSIEETEHATAPLRHSEPLRVKHAPFKESVFTQRHTFVSPAVLGDMEFAPCHCSNHI